MLSLPLCYFAILLDVYSVSILFKVEKCNFFVFFLFVYFVLLGVEYWTTTTAEVLV